MNGTCIYIIDSLCSDAMLSFSVLMGNFDFFPVTYPIRYLFFLSFSIEVQSLCMPNK